MMAFFGALRLVPRWIWILLAVAVAFRLAVGWHAGKIEALEKAAYERGADDQRRASLLLQRERAKLDAKIADELRSKNHEENRRIAAAADRLRLRGAGKAGANSACLPGGAGGHGQAGRNANAAGSGVSAEQWAAVPWPWLVNRGEGHDALRAEVLAWREWHRRLVAEWAKQPTK